MARRCSICDHPEAVKINKLLAKGESLRNIAGRFPDISVSSLHRHKQHLARELAEPIKRQEELAEVFRENLAIKENEETREAITVISELKRCFTRINKLFDACDQWLKDPDNPEQYTLEPRANEVKVIFSEADEDGKPRRRKKALSHLLARLEESGGLQVEGWEVRHADPRELILKTAGRLSEQIEILAKLIILVEQERRIDELEKTVSKEEKGWSG
jgi:hypothetical protein